MIYTFPSCSVSFLWAFGVRCSHHHCMFGSVGGTFAAVPALHMLDLLSFLMQTPNWNGCFCGFDASFMCCPTFVYEFSFSFCRFTALSGIPFEINKKYVSDLPDGSEVSGLFLLSDFLTFHIWAYWKGHTPYPFRLTIWGTQAVKLAIVLNHIRSHWIRCGNKRSDNELLSTKKKTVVFGIWEPRKVER